MVTKAQLIRRRKDLKKLAEITEFGFRVPTSARKTRLKEISKEIRRINFKIKNNKGGKK